jgi:hypothetical protein
MATEKEKAAIMPSDQQFERLTAAVEAIAARATITTTVEPRPLDPSANHAVAEYNAIALSLRTIFEPAITSSQA